MSACISSAALRQPAACSVSPRSAASLAPRSALPQPLIGTSPVRDRGLDLARQHRPAALVQPVAGPGVQVDRVEQHPPDVMLALVPGAVADADRAGALIARQVIEHLLRELA